jgi:hypothetical protein
MEIRIAENRILSPIVIYGFTSQGKKVWSYGLPSKITQYSVEYIGFPDDYREDVLKITGGHSDFSLTIGAGMYTPLNGRVVIRFETEEYIEQNEICLSINLI